MASKIYIESDYINRKFNEITVTRFEGKSNSGHRLVTGVCSCGNFITVKLTALLSNTTKSCGCLKHMGQRGVAIGFKRCCTCREVTDLSNFYKTGSNCKKCAYKINLEWVKNNPGKEAFFCIKGNSKSANRPFTLAEKDFISWYDKESKICHYCSVEEATCYYILNRRLQIDRIDNQSYYLLNNLALACPPCNFAKSHLFDKEDMKVIGLLIFEKWKSGFFRDKSDSFASGLIRHK